jgi:hypothetical protein
MSLGMDLEKLGRPIDGRIHWIGLRENLQETHGFLPSNI